jgi:replicative DNA helicase
MIPELDKKILAYGLMEKRILLDLQTSVPIEYMHADAQPFYTTMLACFKRYKEIPTVSVIKSFGGEKWEDSFGEIYSDVLKLDIDPREFPVDLEKLKTRYNGQILLQFGKEVFQENWDGKSFEDLRKANAALKKVSSSIDAIHRHKIFKEGSLSETAGEALGDYQRIKENPELARGIHLGFREFDRITNGIQTSELLLIGGESSAGKSALAMNMGLNAWRGSNEIPESIYDMPTSFVNDGANILLFSIEMPYIPMRRRCDACIAGIPLYGIRDGTLTEDEEKRFRAALEFQKNYSKQFHILDIPRNCTMSMIESKFIDKCHEYHPDLIIVDYISLMTPDKEQGSDWLNLGRLAEQMHEFCRTYEVSVISPVQLNRPKGANGKNGGGFDPPPPDQHRVGRSIMLTQNSNILLNIETRKDEETRPDMIIKIAKMRDGEKGAFVLHKRLDIMRVYDDIPGWEPQLYEESEGEEGDE